MTRRFQIVDVFTDRAGTGNPLAVVTQAAGMTTKQMQAFAREMNFSETTFVLDAAARRGAWRVRIFTPQSELPFAGHPTIGTAHVIRTALLGGNAERVTLDLPIGPVPVAVERRGRSELYWMRQPHPTYGRRVPHRQLAAVLGLRLADFDVRFPAEEVSTGLPHLIVPLRSRKALAGINVDREAMIRLVERQEAKSVLAFCTGAEDRRNQLSVRVFVDYHGVPEDPATGSGNGCLAAWLVRHRYFGADAIDIRSEQGVTMGRPSVLCLRAMATSQGTEVRIGGGVVTVAHGELVAPEFV